MSGFNLNTVTVGGNLTRDPELRSTTGGTSVCSLRLAVNGRKKDSSGEWIDVPNYFNITVWGRFGELAAERLQKGSRFACTGRLQWREWTTDSGDKRQAVDIVADSMMFPDEGGSGGGRSDVPADTTGLPSSDAPPSTAEDDIPFRSVAYPEPWAERTHWATRPRWRG